MACDFLTISTVVDVVSPEKHRFARIAAIRVLAISRVKRRRRGHGPKILVVGRTLLGLLSLGGGAEAVDKYQTYTQDLPNPSSLSAKELPQSTRIYDRNGVLLYGKHTDGAARTVVPLSGISPHLS